MEKSGTDKLKALAADTVSASHRGLVSAQEAAHDVAGKAGTVVKGLAASATQEAKKLSARVVDTVKDVDAHHKEVAEKVETVSMGLGITSGVVAAGAALAAPTGLGAVGVALGVTSAPLIVTAAPIVGAAAAVTGVVSGGAYFYSKWKTKKEQEEQAGEDPQGK